MGARYEAQQNLRGLQQPRAARCRSRTRRRRQPSSAAGSGIFHSRLTNGTVENPATIRWQPPVRDRHRQSDVSRSVRRRHDPPKPSSRSASPIPISTATYHSISMVSLERTMFTNLLITATYDFQREFHKLRTRNLNAPYDATCAGPATAPARRMTPDRRLRHNRTPTRGQHRQPRVNRQRLPPQPPPERAEALQHLQCVRELSVPAPVRRRPGRLAAPRPRTATTSATTGETRRTRITT